MEAFITNSGDFVFSLTHEELDNWRKTFTLKGSLSEVGEKPSGKDFQITICDKTDRPIDYHPNYESYSQDKVVKFVCNQTAFSRLAEYGELVSRIFKTDIFLRVSDHPRAEVFW